MNPVRSLIYTYVPGYEKGRKFMGVRNINIRLKGGLRGEG